ncbi:MAG TPA: mandelate racemase/muconate lactonizing enzyme family protein [Phototrophicaceae bacterium]|nr:mandelate racemase/muconate lactonizing enzyme family protein [Phototrophicaceae bacterium]
MRITNVTAVHVSIPLVVPYVFARGIMRSFDNVVVRIDTDDGVIGYGESAPLFNSATGDSAVVAEAIGRLGKALIGRDPFDVEALVRQTLAGAGGNVDCVAGIDVALWDVMGKALDLPSYQLMGGLSQEKIPVDFTLSSAPPEAMAVTATSVHEMGFQGVVVKVTGKSVKLAVDEVLQVRAALPADCTVRVDCNGGFTRENALEFLRAIADKNIELVEQPVAQGDLEGARACRAFGIRISLDESLITLADAIAIVRADACDIFNIKIPRVGGFLLAKRMAAIADAAGLPVICGGRTVLEISRAASRHFAASTPGTIGLKHEGPGPASQELSDDVTSKRTDRQATGRAGGFVTVEDEPGLGMDISWEKIEQYAVNTFSAHE